MAMAAANVLLSIFEFPTRCVAPSATLIRDARESIRDLQWGETSGKKPAEVFRELDSPGRRRRSIGRPGPVPVFPHNKRKAGSAGLSRQ
jgi:hypothetical protein